MRILHVADLHYRLGWYEWARRQSDNYDVLVIAGDLLNMLPTEDTPLPQQAKFVREWLAGLPKPAVVCTGNHDMWPANPLVTTDTWADGGWLRLCKREGLVVDGQSARLHREHFAAVKWGCSNWPEATSIVVVHAPPAYSQISYDAAGIDRGDFDVGERIRETLPAYVMSGHVHSARRWVSCEGGSFFFNPCYDRMAPAPNHIYIDIAKRVARWHSIKRGRVDVSV